MFCTEAAVVMVFTHNENDYKRIFSVNIKIIFFLLSKNPTKRPKPPMCQYFLTSLSMALSLKPVGSSSPFLKIYVLNYSRHKSSKKDSAISLNSWTLVFVKCYLNRRKLCICFYFSLWIITHLVL